MPHKEAQATYSTQLGFGSHASLKTNSQTIPALILHSAEVKEETQVALFLAANHFALYMKTRPLYKWEKKERERNQLASRRSSVLCF